MRGVTWQRCWFDEMAHGEQTYRYLSLEPAEDEAICRVLSEIDRYLYRQEVV